MFLKHIWTHINYLWQKQRQIELTLDSIIAALEVSPGHQKEKVERARKEWTHLHNIEF